MSSFGECNEHLIGIFMKEVVRRALMEIRRQRVLYEARQKPGYDGGEDIVTSADLAAQAIYLKSIRECFPTFGIVAEEGGDSPPEPETPYYFTVDPLDGTKAFHRRQSHGVGTMLALVHQGATNAVVAAYVGDVNTEEIYGYRPDSARLHRISDFQTAETLSIPEGRPLNSQYALLRDPLYVYPDWVARVCGPVAVSGCFTGHEIEGGSIGIGMARLWKGEVGAYFLKPGMQTPWDLTPVVGISRHLGFVFLEANHTGTEFRRYAPNILPQPYRTDRVTVVLHASRLPEWERQSGGRVIPEQGMRIA
ncbi:hypothetical protein HYV74_01025 [Candidatus Uhrbacteria bacterium]|nr:hypothetical protein [Candidatus Uhrbacteria bacterium]